MRRAKPTTAMRLPRRAATRNAQALSEAAARALLRTTLHATSTSSDRARELPALVIRPRRFDSPELYSRGTNPRKARTCAAV